MSAVTDLLDDYAVWLGGESRPREVLDDMGRRASEIASDLTNAGLSCTAQEVTRWCTHKAVLASIQYVGRPYLDRGRRGRPMAAYLAERRS